MNEPKKARAKTGTGKVLFVDLGSSSVKAKLVAALGRAGFPTLTDGILTVIGDLTSNRIKYRDGKLVRPAKSA